MAVEELNVEAAVDSIASDIGFGATEGNNEDADATSTDLDADPGESRATDDAGGDSDPAAQQPKPGEDQPAAAQARSAPKAWAKEQHEHWAKLDPKVQDYIEHREKQMLEGLGQYAEGAKFAKAVKEVISPHMELIKAQNIAPEQAIGYLFNAHRQLSTGTPEQRAAHLQQIAKTYGIDISKAAASAGQASEEPAYVRELRERTERLERERQSEREAALQEQSKKAEQSVTSFADAKDEKGNLKHPYFDECAEDIVALINAGHTLEKAYEKAVYANPVTREKEIARLAKERDATLRAKAKKEAESARSGSRANVTSRDTGRAPTAPKGQKWEDTLETTMQEIKERTTH